MAVRYLQNKLEMLAKIRYNKVSKGIINENCRN
jgi:hypothetical protein